MHINFTETIFCGPFFYFTDLHVKSLYSSVSRETTKYRLVRPQSTASPLVALHRRATTRRDMLKFEDIANIHNAAIARRSRRSWLKITRQLYTFLSADAFLITPTTIMPSANPQCRRLYSWRRDKRALPSHCQHHDVVCALKTTPSSV